MARAVFSMAMAMAMRCFDAGGGIVFISGGEPMEHPAALEVLRLAHRIRSCKRRMRLHLLSNGMFLADRALAQQVLGLVDVIQVTHDASFYPHEPPQIDHQRIDYTRVRKLVNLGRARALATEQDRPACHGIRERVLDGLDLRDGLIEMRRTGLQHNCTIQADGTITLGPSPQCATLGHVYTATHATLTAAVREATCAACSATGA